MRAFGRCAVSEFLGDRVVYRNLQPVDDRLPPLDAFRGQVGLPAGYIPRKSELDYARVIVYLLSRMRTLDAPGTVIERLVFIGDTRLNDSTAFANICQAGGWPGRAFIGSETTRPANVEIAPQGEGRYLYLANRWAALDDFEQYLYQEEFALDEATAVIIDLDKTALGARGRNAHTIDRARVQAVRDTVASLLGDDFDSHVFQGAYDSLNQVEYHAFTSDNQDYLAYICLVLGTGLYDLETVLAQVRSGSLTSFRQFIDQVDLNASRLPTGLAELHAEIYANVCSGDPTPFKSFRRNEYVATIAKMGHLPDTASIETLLADEILITQEVRAIALNWQSRGVLLFGLSDKPDEASVPSRELAAQGFLPIHQMETHAVGER